MNCPKCQKPLPKGQPRVCPNCKKDLSNFYKMKETQSLLEAEKEKSQKTNRIVKLLAAALLICALVVAAVLLIPKLGGSSASPSGTEPEKADGTQAQQPAAALDMSAVKAEIDSQKPEDFTESAEPTDYVKISVKNFGELVVKLRPDLAPISAQNFKDLVARHYYDGTSFHRVYPGFMIQGGAGKEGLSPIKGEFSSNGVENPLLHVRGVLSMARTTVKDSATSQFFLMHADNATLDGNYAAFGYIVAGLETVDKVCQIPLGDNPYNGEHSVPQVDVIIESAVFVAPK